MGRIKQFTRQQDLPGTLEQVFAFFQQPENLGRLTPPEQRFEILTPAPVPMHVGARIDYRLRVLGRWLRWTSEITEYTAPHGFVDVQLRGPYAYWHHRHHFEQWQPNVVRMTDTVDYALPLWPLSEIGGTWWVERQLNSIFEFRRAAVARLLVA
jgi:ligand-binding SRPBCC domain-containing protein